MGWDNAVLNVARRLEWQKIFCEIHLQKQPDPISIEVDLLHESIALSKPTVVKSLNNKKQLLNTVSRKRKWTAFISSDKDF